MRRRFLGFMRLDGEGRLLVECSEVADMAINAGESRLVVDDIE